MRNHKNYTGIDIFRFFAALLIVAIHTSPLASFSDIGNFILTRVIARTAVPFFFMTTGFFLISRYSCNNKKLKKFVKKTAILYGIAILIYLPINAYNGYFRMEAFAPSLIKDLLFDGTFYHLWYLPAAMLGAAIAWWLIKRSYKKAAIAAVLLYLIGLFGDSYYGIVKNTPGINSFYTFIFQVTDYTRNGIFFAPVFFLLGGLIADCRYKIPLRNSLCGLVVSFALMLSEAMLLHHFGIQRHDSMYLFLPLCMYFLFSLLLHYKGKRHLWLRTSSLIIYIIHPLIIVVIRFIAKLLHLQPLLVENSIVHYLAVCLSSIAVSMAAAAIWNKRPRKAKHNPDTDRAYVEIDLNNLAYNAITLQKVMHPKCRLMAVVKAQAYGHGAFEVAVHLNKVGIRAFAVATIDEGIRLRKYGIQGEILILGYTSVERAAELKKHNLTQTLIDDEYASALNKQNVAVKAHIKIDTGMHRLGIPVEDLSRVKKVFAMKNIKVSGIFTHLCCSDSIQPDDIAFTKGQLDRFYTMIDALKSTGIAIPKLHIQSSYGLLNYPALKCDYVRAGIALYGAVSPGSNIALRPVLALKSKVVLIRSVRKGDSIGYGRSFTAKRDSRIAVLPIGYGDGVPRNLSCGSGSVLINQQRVPIVGQICMDQLMADITDAGDVACGDTATLIGSDGSETLSATAVADNAGSISNELLCRMGARLPVVIKGGS